MSYLDILADKQVINRYQIDDVMEQAATMDGDVDAALELMGINEMAVRDAKSEAYGVPVYADVPAVIPYDILRYIAADSARYYKIAPIAMQDGQLIVGMVDPGNIEAQNALQFMFSSAGLAY